METLPLHSEVSFSIGLVSLYKLIIKESVTLHILLALWTIIAAWCWGNWRSLSKYYPTMLYIIVGASIYLFLYGKDTLWNVKGSFLADKQNELMYLLIIMPGSAFVYLSTLPEVLSKQIFHTIKWILIFIIVELISWHLDMISYNSGWNIWWSLLFDCMMFPMLKLHLIKPYLAVIISIFIAIILMQFFPPIWG